METDCRPEPGVAGVIVEMAGEVRVTGKETLGLSSLKDFDGVSPASLDERVCCESLGPEDVLEDIVGADDFLRLTKLGPEVGGFLELGSTGAMLGFVPRLMDAGDPRAEPRSLVVA